MPLTNKRNGHQYGIIYSSKQFVNRKTENPAGICATITIVETTYPKAFTAEYGISDCVDNQIKRKGKLEITLSGPIIITGSKMIIKRIDYSINEFKLEGTIEYTNTTTIATIPNF